MKKKKAAGMGVMCAVLLLWGCQPTTDQVIVEPKNAIAGAKMIDEATVGNVPEQVQAPKTCTLAVAAEDGAIRINGEAKVTVPEVDGIRLKKVETRIFNQADMDNLQENLMQGNPLKQRICTEEQKARNILWTRGEIEEIIRKGEAYYKEMYQEKEAYGVDSSYAEDLLEYWYEQLEMAPESFPEKEVSTKVLYDKYAAEKFISDQGSTGNSNTIWGNTVLDGQTYNFLLNNNWSADFKNVTACLTKGYRNMEISEWSMYSSDQEYYLDSYMAGGYMADEENIADSAMQEKLWKDGKKDIISGNIGMAEQKGPEESVETEAEMAGEQELFEDMDAYIEDAWTLETPLEDSKAKGDALADALGLEDMELAAYKKCENFDGYLDMPLSAMNLIYTPMVDGIPVTYTDYRYTYDNETQDYSECFQVAYDDEGLVQVKWQNPSKIYDMSDEYVFLLPFSDILKIFQEQAPELHRTYGTDEDVKKFIYITDIKLGYMWVPDEATEMEGMLIPVWDFIGCQATYWTGNPDEGIVPSWSMNTSPYQSFLTVNAMDGSVVEGAVRPF